MIVQKKRAYDILREIPYGTRPKVLLVGNGINRPFSQKVRTDGIIEQAWEKAHPKDASQSDQGVPRALWDLPLPLQVVAATGDNVQDCMTDLAKTFREATVPADQKVFTRQIVDTGFDAILTTNYSLEFEKSQLPVYTPGKVYSLYRTTNKQTTQQAKLGIYQCTELPDQNHTLLWHIHGTALRKESMVMGQFYYGKLLSEVIARANSVNSEYRGKEKNGLSFRPKSWVDYFLIGDVYIMGFGLDLSESDIWWLLSFKKSAFENSSVIFYDPNKDLRKELLLDCYDVKIQTERKGRQKTIDYVAYYQSILQKLK